MESFRVRLLPAVVIGAAILVGQAAVVAAQSTVTLPDTSQTTTVSIAVSEQARVAVPSGISFSVSNVGAATAAAAATVTIDQVVLASASKQLRVSLKANAAAFTPPTAGDTTWPASDVSWNAAAWTAASGAAGTLSQTAFNTVATCDAGVAGCSTSALVFTLAPNPAVQRSGTHTLVVTWKVESIGS